MQLYGLYSLWGHNREPLEGAVALKAVATVVRPYNESLSDAIVNKFKEEYIIRYYKKEHR